MLMRRDRQQAGLPHVNGDRAARGVNGAVLSRERHCREENQNQTRPHIPAYGFIDFDGDYLEV